MLAAVGIAKTPSLDWFYIGMRLRYVKPMQESRKPPANRGPSRGLFGRLAFALHRFLDLQVASVIAEAAPWLRARSGSVLEVGCGDQPYRSFLPRQCAYTGLDWARADSEFSMQHAPDVVYYSGTRFPFGDDRFDSLFHTEVLEHVPDYRIFLSECRRVMKPGGEMMFSVPFQARFHFIPHDYWRFTKSGLEIILVEAGFEDIRVSARGTDVVVAAYKVVSVFYRVAHGGFWGKAVFVAFSWLVAFLLCFAHAAMAFGLGSSDDCLGYSVVVCRPL